MDTQRESQQADQPAILVTGADTQNAFGVVLHTLPPYSAIQSLHCHERHLEACFVIAGTLALTCEEETVMLRHGALQVLQAGVRHTCWNPTATPTRLLLIYAPGASETELRRLAVGEDGSEINRCNTS